MTPVAHRRGWGFPSAVWRFPIDLQKRGSADEKPNWMPDHVCTRRLGRALARWARGIAALAVVLAGCAGLTSTPQSHKIDRVSRSSEAFLSFLQSPGNTIDEIREFMSSASIDSVYLIDENVTNEELGEYIQFEASDYPFEIFLRVTVSTADRRVYRYIVKGDWRSVKMGYGSLRHPELYDAIYLHTHPRGKRVIPNSISDYIHAGTFGFVSTLLVGNGVPIEFESIEGTGNGVDWFEVDGRRFSLKRPEKQRSRSKEHLRRNRRDADAAVRELDRVFRENVEAGHERVTLRNSEGMLVTYDRNRALGRRLNEVYWNADLPLPTGGEDFTASSDVTRTPPSKVSPPLGL